MCMYIAEITQNTVYYSYQYHLLDSDYLKRCPVCTCTPGNVCSAEKMGKYDRTEFVLILLKKGDMFIQKTNSMKH